MKKVLLVIIAALALFMTHSTANAQKKTKIADGVYLVTYGKIAVIEDDNTSSRYPFRSKNAKIVLVAQCMMCFVATSIPKDWLRPHSKVV